MFDNDGDNTPKPAATGLNLERFQPKAPPPVDEKEVAAVGEASGFTTKHARKPKKLDGRSLKKSARTHQFNVRLKPQTAERFWAGAKAAGFEYADDFLEYLLVQHECRGGGSGEP